MKVDVIQAKDITFKRFCWWSDWIDVAVYDFYSQPWLIQMKVNRFNAKKFKSVCLVGFKYRQTTSAVVGDLKQMSKEKGND